MIEVRRSQPRRVPGRLLRLLAVCGPLLPIVVDLADRGVDVDGRQRVRPGQILFRITLRLAAPMLAVVGLLSFAASLNEILLANVFLTDTSQKTLAIGLFGLVSGAHNTAYGEFAAGSLLAALPVVLIYLFAKVPGQGPDCRDRQGLARVALDGLSPRSINDPLITGLQRRKACNSY